MFVGFIQETVLHDIPFRMSSIVGLYETKQEAIDATMLEIEKQVFTTKEGDISPFNFEKLSLFSGKSDDEYDSFDAFVVKLEVGESINQKILIQGNYNRSKDSDNFEWILDKDSLRPTFKHGVKKLHARMGYQMQEYQLDLMFEAMWADPINGFHNFAY